MFAKNAKSNYLSEGHAHTKKTNSSLRFKN